MELNLNKFKFNDVHIKPIELVILLNNLITILKTPPRKGRLKPVGRWTYNTLAIKTGRNIRSIKKDLKTLVLMWAPIYMCHSLGWQLIDKQYEMSLTYDVARVLLNKLNAEDNINLSGNNDIIDLTDNITNNRNDTK